MSYPLQKAVDIAGGQSDLAKKINTWLKENGRVPKNLKQQHIWKWLKHSSGIPTAPPEYRLAIEEITEKSVTVRELSHDIYPLDLNRENSNAA